MKKNSTGDTKRTFKAIRRSALVMTALMGAVNGAQAIEITTGNPDLSVTLGNTVRYNVGWRMEGRDSVIANSASNDEGTYSFDRRDNVMNRLDLLTELDLNYRKQIGLRVSTSLWFDKAFHEDVRTNPTFVNRGSYTGNRFSDYTRRYSQGPSGEVLDAFVFANFDLAGMSGNVKAGRHTVLWGEAIVLSAHGVSYAQAPSDGLKALTTPGADAKETAMPVGQISGSLQVTPTVSVFGQYYYEWEPTRLPEGGTYLGGTDFILQGPDRFSAAPGLFLANRGVVKPKDRGDYGIGARWDSEALGGILGVYYRDFTERSPTVSLNIAGGNYKAVYPAGAKLYGLSFAKSILGTSAGFELVRRENTALNSSISNGASEGARGSTWHALANVVKLWGPNDIWSTASLSAELAYSRWDEVTSGAALFNSCARRPVGDQEAGTGCVTKDAWQTFLRFGPSWTAVAPGWDVSAAASLLVGLKGNGAVLGGGNYKAGSYSLGLTLTYNSQHDFSIAYNDYLGTNQANAAGAARVSNGSQIQDRGWVALTYKGSY